MLRERTPESRVSKKYYIYYANIICWLCVPHIIRYVKDPSGDGCKYIVKTANFEKHVICVIKCRLTGEGNKGIY